MRLSWTGTEIRGFKDFGVTSLTLASRDVIGHVIIWLGICGFLFVVHCNHASILHRNGDMKPQRYWGNEFDLLGSRDVISHVTIRLGICGFPLKPCVYLAPLRRYKASKFHLPMWKAKISQRMLRVTWSVGGGSKITTYLEFPSPHCLFTIQLLWGYDDD